MHRFWDMFSNPALMLMIFVVIVALVTRYTEN